MKQWYAGKCNKDKMLWFGRGIIYVLLFVALIPYLNTGYMGDDILNSLVKGECINTTQNIGSFILTQLKELIKLGRIDFLSWIVAYVVYYFTGTVRVIYKIVIICMTFFSLCSAERFVGYHFANKHIGMLYTLLLVACFPVYMMGSNSVAMYWGFMQIEVIFLFEMLLSLEKYIDRGERRYLILSGGIFMCSLFTYEISYLYIIAIVTIVFFRSRTDAKRIVKPYIIICVGALLLNLICKIGVNLANPAMAYDGTSLGTGLREMITVFVIQFLGAIPMYSFVVEVTQDRTSLDFMPMVLVGAGIVIMCVAFLTFLVHGQGTEGDKKSPAKECVIIGTVIWVGIAAMIAVTEKYQREIPISKAPHIPVYVEYFMMMLLALLVCLWIVYTNKMQLRTKCCIMLVAVMVAGVNYFTGEALVTSYVEATRTLYVDMPEAYQAACENGLLDGIEDGDRIIIDIAYSPTIYPNLFAQYSGRVIAADRMDQFIEEMTQGGIAEGSYCPEENLYTTKSFFSGEQTVVYLEKVSSIEFEEAGIAAIEISDIRAYCIAEKLPQSLVVTSDGKVDVIESAQCDVTDKGENQYLIELPEGKYDYYSYAYWN